MKAIITFTNGEKVTATGEIVEAIRGYFEGGTRLATAIGWVAISGKVLNFAHVMHVVFEGEEN